MNAPTAATTVTHEYQPSWLRRLVGTAVAVGLLPAAAAVVWAVGAAFVAVAVAVQVLSGLPQDRVVLLDRFTGLAVPAGIIFCSVRHPFAFWGKVLRHLQGHRVGYTLPLSGAPAGTPGVINRLEVVRLNGADHVVRIRAGNVGRHGRVLLVLHGGPGASELIAGLDHGLRRALEHDFVIVDYDQRSALASGCLHDPSLAGIRSAALRASLTVPQHVADCAALADWLAADPQLRAAAAAGGATAPTIHLMGGSWGSVLALRTAQAHPSKFASPIVVRGLVANQTLSEERAMAWLRAQAGKAGATADLSTLDGLTGVPAGSFAYVGKDGVAQMIRQRQLLEAYGGVHVKELRQFEATGKRGAAHSMLFDKVIEAVRTPEFSLLAILGGKGKMVATLEGFGDVFRFGDHIGIGPGHPAYPCATALRGLDVVVAHGRHDVNTSHTVVEAYLRDVLRVDPGRTKRLSWFAGSGHGPDKEEPAAFAALLRHVWLGAPAEGLVYPLATL